jgi:drug/metabolite transporter (DMT)-like permease
MSESTAIDTVPPISRRQQLLAAGLVFTGALCFSAKAVFVKLAYRHEVDSISLLALRMLFSLPLFLLLAWWSNRKVDSAYAKPEKGDWLQIMLVGILGYYLASMFDFLGLQYIDASIERLILFIYPTIVLVISAVWFKQKISSDQFLALVLSYVGVALAFLCGREIGDSSNFYLGGGLIFISAITYAFYLIGSGRLLPKFGTLRFTSYAMMAACAAVLIHHGVVRHWRLFHFHAEVYYLSILIALVSTVLPAFLVSEGIRLIGAGNAAIISTVGPVSTIVLAYIFLNERLNGWQALGGLLVIGGVLLISLRKPRRKALN